MLSGDSPSHFIHNQKCFQPLVQQQNHPRKQSDSTDSNQDSRDAMRHLLPRPVSSHQLHPAIDLHRSRKRAATAKPTGLWWILGVGWQWTYCKGYFQVSIVHPSFSLFSWLLENRHQPERIKFRTFFRIIYRVIVSNISWTNSPSTHLASGHVRSNSLQTTRQKWNLNHRLSIKINRL